MFDYNIEVQLDRALTVSLFYFILFYQFSLSCLHNVVRVKPFTFHKVMHHLIEIIPITKFKIILKNLALI